MTVRQALQAAAGATDTIDVTLTGWLVVAKGLAYFADVQLDPAANLEPAVLVTDDRVARGLAASGIPIMVGSIVEFELQAELTGMLVSTPLPQFPGAVVRAERLLVHDEGRRRSIVLPEA
jgi:hypothetical protein